MSQLNEENRLRKANQLKKQGEVNEAIASYCVVIEKNPKCSWCYHNIGECLALQGKLDEAIINYYKAIELNPSLGCFYYNLAEAFFKKGSLEQAIACYNQAIEITPSSQFEQRLVEVIKEYDDLDQTLFSFFTKLTPKDWNFLSENNSGILVKRLTQDLEARKNLGLLYFGIGQKLNKNAFHREAELIFNSAIKLNNNLYWAHHILACMLKGKRQYEQAIDHFMSAIKLNPNEYGHYWRLAQTYREQENIDLAIETYKKALHLKKDNRVQEELDILLILHNINNHPELPSSSKCLEKLNVENIINQYLDRPNILIKLAEIYEKENKIPEANQIKQAVSVHFELDSSSEVLLIVFSSRNDDRAKIQFQFRKVLSQVDVKKIFIRDVPDAWYNKGLKNITDNIEGIAEYLKGQIDRIKPEKLITLGSSSGGYASLLFGYLLNADQCIAFGPQTKIPRPQPFPDSALLVGCNIKYFDLLDLRWENVKTVCRIHYSEDFISDKDAAIRMEALANFKLYSYPAGKIHNIAGWLKNQGKLESIVLEVIENS